MAAHVDMEDLSVPNYNGTAKQSKASGFGQLHTLTVDEVAEALETHPLLGLSHLTVEKRREIFGTNALPTPARVPIWRQMLKFFTDLFSLMLLFAATLCFIAYGLDRKDPANAFLGAFLLLVVVVTSLFSFYQQYSSDETLREFKNFLPPKATVIREGGALQIIPAIDLVPGDLVKIKLGDKIPADIRIIRNMNLRVDNSALTGEAEPVERCVHMTSENYLETNNLVFFGCLAIDGAAEGIVIATGENTVFGRIVQLTSDARKDGEQTTLQKDMHHFVVSTAGCSFAIGVAFFVAGLLNGIKIIRNLVFSIAIIVSNIPEGLIATVTVALTASARRMAYRKVLVKSLEAVESLGSTTVICSDKTGTLTEGKMNVRHVMYADHLECIDESWTPPRGAEEHSRSNGHSGKACFDTLFYGAANCSTALFDAMDASLHPEKSINQRVVSGDASEAGILRFCEQISPVESVRWANKVVALVPFNSNNKYMISVHRNDIEPSILRVLVKGAPEKVLEKCSTILGAFGERELAERDRVFVQKQTTNLANLGERVLAFAQTHLSPQESSCFLSKGTLEADLGRIPASGYSFVGLISLQDPPRSGVRDAVRKCCDAGIRVIMVTGDHPGTARAISKEVGIILSSDESLSGMEIESSNSVIITGQELSDFTIADWDRVLTFKEVVFARTSPEQKLVIVKQLQRRGEVVSVTGDGVNDAPALKQAETGIAMGISGSDVSKEAADIVLLDDNFSSIVNGIEEGRLIFDNLKKSIAYSLTSNVPQLMPFLVLVVLHIPVPLTTVLILSIDLGTDIFPAIALAYEQEETDLMTRPPRDSKTERLLNPRLLSYAMLQLGIIQCFAGFFAYFFVMYDFGFAPVSLVHLDRRGRFGTTRLADQRWLFTFKERPQGFVYDAKWFSRTNPMFQPYFNSTKAGFSRQTIDRFDRLAALASKVPASADANTSFPENEFSNMIKIVGHELNSPPCYEYYCRLNNDSKLLRNEMSCFNPKENSKPILFSGLRNRNENSNLRGKGQRNGNEYNCFDLWTPVQEREVLLYAQTGFFAAIVVAQVFTVLTCKTRILSLFKHRLRNVTLLLSILVEVLVAMTIIYSNGLQRGFGVRPLRALHWLPGVPFGLFIIAYDELRKALIRIGLEQSNIINDADTAPLSVIQRLGKWTCRNTLW